MTLKIACDSIVLLDEPIPFLNDNLKEIRVYGIVYDAQQAHDADLFMFMVNRYLCYLLASSIILCKGGQLSPDELELPNGDRISLQTEYKNLIYRIMRDRLPSYSLIERDILDLKADEIDGNFLISPAPLKRMNIEYSSQRTKKGYQPNDDTAKTDKISGKEVQK